MTTPHRRSLLNQVRFPRRMVCKSPDAPQEELPGIEKLLAGLLKKLTVVDTLPLLASSEEKAMVEAWLDSPNPECPEWPKRSYWPGLPPDSIYSRRIEVATVLLDHVEGFCQFLPPNPQMGSSADLGLASCSGVVASVAGYIFELDERCIVDIPRPFFCTVEAKTSVELEDKIPFIRELADLYGDSFTSEGPVVDREGTMPQPRAH